MAKKVSDIHLPQKTELKKEKSQMTDEEKKEIKRRKEFFESKKGRKRKFFAVFSALLIFLFFGLLKMVSSEREFKKNFYASECSGGWQNPANAEGIPDVFSDGSIDSFSERNSAVYRTGPQNLECQWFNEIKKQAEENKKDPCGKDYELCNLTEARITFSFAINNYENIDSTDQSKDENLKGGPSVNFNQEDRTNTVSKTIVKTVQAQEETSMPTTPAASPIENTKPVVAPTTDTTTGTTTDSATEEPIVTQPAETNLNLDARIIIYYSLDNGKTWNFFENIKTVPFSNHLNGGYITLDTPFIKNWYDVENFRIKLEGVIGGEEKLVAYLDSVWIETVAKKQFRSSEEVSEEVSEKIFSMFKDKKSPENSEIIKKEFEYKIPSDGKIIATVKNPDQSIDGFFRIHFFSSKNKLVGILLVVSGQLSKFKGYNLPPPEAGKLTYKSFFKDQKELSSEIRVKKEWKDTKITVEYIPISGKEKLGLDNLEMTFVSEKILLDKVGLIGKVNFNAKDKKEKKLNFSAKDKGDIIINLLESGLGGGAFLMLLDDSVVGVVEVADGLEEVISLKNIPQGDYKLSIKQMDTKSGWQDNKGERRLEIYFKEAIEPTTEATNSTPK